MKKAIADAYTPFFGRTLDPETEVTITTGANEGQCAREWDKDNVTDVLQAC